MPWHFEVVAQPELFGQGDIPACILVQRVAGALRRKVIIVIGRVLVHGQAPLPEVVFADNSARHSLGLA